MLPVYCPIISHPQGSASYLAKLTIEMQMNCQGERDFNIWQVNCGFEGCLGACCVMPGIPPQGAVRAKEDLAWLEMDLVKGQGLKKYSDLFDVFWLLLYMHCILVSPSPLASQSMEETDCEILFHWLGLRLIHCKNDMIVSSQKHSSKEWMVGSIPGTARPYLTLLASWEKTK